MRRTLWILAALIEVFGVTASQSASAAQNPFLTVSFTGQGASGGFGNVDYAGHPFVINTPWIDPSGHGSATVVSRPIPSLTITATSDPNTATSNYETTAQAKLTYYFSVLGPIPDLSVPLIISGNYSFSNTDSHTAQSIGFVTSSLSGYSIGASSLSGLGSHSFLGSILASVSAGEGSVQMTAYADVRGANSATVFIDPYIAIDPVWATTHPGYTIAVTQGFGNSPPVPENGTALMLAMGIAVILLLRRRWDWGGRQLAVSR